MVGTTTVGGANSTVLFPFANTFVSSNGINRDSATRISVIEAGFYELIIPLAVRAAHGSGFIPDSIQYGVNGVWTNLTTSGSVNTGNGFFGQFNIVVEIPAGGYFELRSVTSLAPTAHTVYCSMGAGSAVSDTWAQPTYTIKRL